MYGSVGYGSGGYSIFPGAAIAASGTNRLVLAGTGTSFVIFGAGPQLATGGSRVYNLPDVIANLNDDVNQANTPDLTDITPFTNLAAGSEKTNMVDILRAQIFALPEWGTAQWGLATWT